MFVADLVGGSGIAVDGRKPVKRQIAALGVEDKGEAV